MSSGETEKWAADLPENFVLCRDTAIHHSWQPWKASFDKHAHQYVRALHCDRCGAVKEEHLDSDGYRVKGKAAKYASGYLRPKGAGRLMKEDNAILRLESVLRTMKRI